MFVSFILCRSFILSPYVRIQCDKQTSVPEYIFLLVCSHSNELEIANIVHDTARTHTHICDCAQSLTRAPPRTKRNDVNSYGNNDLRRWFLALLAVRPVRHFSGRTASSLFLSLGWTPIVHVIHLFCMCSVFTRKWKRTNFPLAVKCSRDSFQQRMLILQIEIQASSFTSNHISPAEKLDWLQNFCCNYSEFVECVSQVLAFAVSLDFWRMMCQIVCKLLYCLHSKRHCSYICMP